MTQSQDTGDIATADAASRLLTAIDRAMQAAQASVAKQQDERDQKLAAALSAQAAGASSRATQIIAGIPGIVEYNTKLALESPVNFAGGDRCEAVIMRLNALESEVDPNLCAADKFNPDPAQLRYAARLVFDFCDRPELGLHPKVVMLVGYDQSSTAYQYLAIEISWQLPAKRVLDLVRQGLEAMPV